MPPRPARRSPLASATGVRSPDASLKGPLHVPEVRYLGLGTADEVYCGAGAARTNRLLAEDPGALAHEFAAQLATPLAGH